MQRLRFQHSAAVLLAVPGLLVPAAVAVRVAWGSAPGTGDDPVPVQTGTHDVDPPTTTVAPPTTHWPFPSFEPRPPDSDLTPYEDPRLPVDHPTTTLRPCPCFPPQWDPNPNGSGPDVDPHAPVDP